MTGLLIIIVVLLVVLIMSQTRDGQNALGSIGIVIMGGLILAVLGMGIFCAGGLIYFHASGRLEPKAPHDYGIQVKPFYPGLDSIPVTKITDPGDQEFCAPDTIPDHGGCSVDSTLSKERQEQGAQELATWSACISQGPVNDGSVAGEAAATSLRRTCWANQGVR